jgi:hypothetical protein
MAQAAGPHRAGSLREVKGPAGHAGPVGQTEIDSPLYMSGVT